MATNEIDVRMGEMAVGSGKTTIKTGGIGSCVVVVIYDEEAKVGGLAHSMLPTRKTGMVLTTTDPIDKEPVAKYVDEGINRLVDEVKKAGGSCEHMQARLIGGAHMFKSIPQKESGIGERNLEVARATLAEQNIPIHAEEVSGSVGRLAELDLQNGIVNVTTKM